MRLALPLLLSLAVPMMAAGAEPDGPELPPDDPEAVAFLEKAMAGFEGPVTYGVRPYLVDHEGVETTIDRRTIDGLFVYLADDTLKTPPLLHRGDSVFEVHDAIDRAIDLSPLFANEFGGDPNLPDRWIRRTREGSRETAVRFESDFPVLDSSSEADQTAIIIRGKASASGRVMLRRLRFETGTQRLLWTRDDKLEDDVLVPGRELRFGAISPSEAADEDFAIPESYAILRPTTMTAFADVYDELTDKGQPSCLATKLQSSLLFAQWRLQPSWVNSLYDGAPIAVPLADESPTIEALRRLDSESMGTALEDQRQIAADLEDRVGATRQRAMKAEMNRMLNRNQPLLSPRPVAPAPAPRAAPAPAAAFNVAAFLKAWLPTIMMIMAVVFVVGLVWQRI